MIKYATHLGSVTIAQNYFAKLIGDAASSCYGVVSMVPRGFQRLRSTLLRRTFNDTGIRVRGNDQSLTVDLHITVLYGMNIGAVSKSIIHKVTYVVEEATGIKVSRVIVHVDKLIEE